MTFLGSPSDDGRNPREYPETQRPWRRREYNIKMELSEILCEDADWIKPDSLYGPVVDLIMAMIHGVPQIWTIY
jgi:hypothetical protein